ncbi:MAG: CRISPR-associated primase-polymerase type B [Bacteroides sp.]|nr:CRISPR-associated primase-polymerase type B [Bacteroides sp.]
MYDIRGKKITGNADPLAKIPLDYIYHRIKNPKQEIGSLIRQLRIIREIDHKRYSLLKRELPYLVCGVFNPPVRRTENFAFIEYFIVDIDHISHKGLSIDQVRSDINQDPCTVMSFLSPGEDGLKVMFRLKERCYDHGLYALFYKAFVRRLSETYHLEQVIDTRTSDVCRACFISSDPQVYYHPDARHIDITDYIDHNNPLALFEMKKELADSIRNTLSVPNENLPKEKDPNLESIQKIKNILRLRSHPGKKALPYVPEQLNEMMEELRRLIVNTGIQVYEIININYGKKIKMKLGLKMAEINLFYGKRGFSVVKSPKSGTNSELNDIAFDLISEFLYS